MRKWIANKLAELARRIYPTAPEVLAFYRGRMVDLAITGKSFVKITRAEPNTPFDIPVFSVIHLPTRRVCNYF